MCFLRYFVFTVWGIVGRGVNPSDVRRVPYKECVLKLSWPSTAEYKMIKLKKTKHRLPVQKP